MEQLSEDIRKKIEEKSAEIFPTPKPGDYPNNIILNIAGELGKFSAIYENGCEFGYHLRDEEVDNLKRDYVYWKLEGTAKDIEIAQLKSRVEELERDKKFLHDQLNRPKDQSPF